ncbi:MAG: hypothetical protein A3C53_06665 [Omnitrophica WOR_2 bacterium RIFCSPHIGHO2_02_FULL_68_15]|nr:MAG: hypothetical protein A3C53_06665 [Omnitrophica WOR_2 bacterium RIFCSPHIGHO2_02_FULL_68_15]
MTPQQIARFFTVMARALDAPATVVLTGAAAGTLMGAGRPSLDVDFAVVLPWGRPAVPWSRVEQAVQAATRQTGIAAQFAEDISRWSLISFLEYRRHTRPYRRFGRLDVRVLEPPYWAIGKLTRYLDLDVEDLIRVLRRARLAPEPLARLWGRALKASPRSDACWSFRRHVETFFHRHGPAIWGRAFASARALAAFHRAAGLQET